MERLLNLIAPHHCLGCEVEGALLCEECIGVELPPLESSCFLCSTPTVDYNTCKECLQKTNVAQLLACTEYNGLCKEVLYQLKFNRSKYTARLIASIIYDNFAEEISSADVLTYIPTATARVRKRGYDQSKEITKELSRLSGVEMQIALARIDQSRSVGSSKMQRNNAQQYRVVKELQDKSIILIDDVATTGGTFKKAASYLDKSNCIIGLVFARTPLS